MISLEIRGICKSFKEAWTTFMKEMRKETQDGTSWQVLETTYFLTFKFDENELVFSFYEAQDFAYTIGLMKDGKINGAYNDAVMEPLIRQVLREFGNKNVSECIKDIQEKIKMRLSR
jgi:hypothetical protein